MLDMRTLNKKITQNGGRKPIEHERVTCSVTLTIDHKNLFENQLVIFDLGHSEDFGVIKVLDDIVETMGVDEKCSVELTVSEGLTIEERQQLNFAEPENGMMTLVVHLRDIQRLTDFWNMAESDKIAVAGVMKRRGNKLLNAKKYARAIRTYKNGIRYLRGSVSVLKPNGPEIENPSYSPEAVRLLLLCYANAALCFLHLASLFRPAEPVLQKIPLGRDRQLLRMCIKYCRSATDLDPSYAKSWLRLAKAHAELKEFEEAVEAGDRCLKCLETMDQHSVASLITETNKHLTLWRKELANVEYVHRRKVRDAFLKAYDDSDEMSSEDEMEKFPISVWSNSLADNMMSLHEELEAFGEKMPERKPSRTSRRLETIADEEEEAD